MTLSRKMRRRVIDHSYGKPLHAEKKQTRWWWRDDDDDDDMQLSKKESCTQHCTGIEHTSPVNEEVEKEAVWQILINYKIEKKKRDTRCFCVAKLE